MLSLICRRSLSLNNSISNNNSTILYNQFFARRWRSTSKKKGKGKSKSFAKRKKLTLTTANDSSKKSTKPIIIDASKQSLQSRGNTSNIEKARHMQQPKITQSVPSKVFTWVQANPFLPIVIILPTFTTGIIIWSRPEVWTNRSKFLGGTGGADRKKMIPTGELPVYEDEEEESDVVIIVDDGKKDEEEWEMVDKEVTVPSTEKREKTEKPAVVDLLYAIGIRPHSSQ